MREKYIFLKGGNKTVFWHRKYDYIYRSPIDTSVSGNVGCATNNWKYSFLKKKKNTRNSGNYNKYLSKTINSQESKQRGDF